MGAVAVGGVAWEGEGFHAEGVGAVGVFEDGASDALLTDEGADAGEGDVEAVGLGELRGEEAELDFACCSGSAVRVTERMAAEGGCACRSRWRRRSQRRRSLLGSAGTDGAGVGAAAFEGERDGDGGEGENLRGGAGDEVVEEDAEDEEERVEELDGRVEFDALFEE